ASVSAGTTHSLAVRTDGTLWAWGNNASGQLGTGGGGSSATPVQVGAATNWASVSAGANHSLAVGTDGTLWAWGLNSSGQLGKAASSATPLPIYTPPVTMPMLAATPGATLAPEQVPTAVDGGLSVTSASSATLVSATVSLSSGLVPAEDALAFVPAGNITGAYDAATGVLSLASAAPFATLADWQAVLRSITYLNASDTPTTADRTVSFVVNDGGLDSSPATKLVQVQAVNDAPAAPADTDPAPNAVAENAPAGTPVGLTVAATDVDSPALTYTLTDDAGGRFVIEPVTGVVRVAPGAVLDFEAAGSYTVTAQATDGSLTSSLAFVIALTDVNEAPVVADQSYTTQEDGAAGTVVGTVLATDPDAGQALTYTLTAGNTNGAFALVGNQLQVANAAALDLAATPVFTLTVDVADNGTPALTTPATLTVTLTPAPCTEPQGVAVGSIGTNTASVSFAGSATAASGYRVTYTAAGGPAQTVTAPASPVALAGLQPNTTYDVTVTSICSRSQSAVSATTSFTTLCEVPVLAAIASQRVNVDAGLCGASVSFAASASGTPAPALSFTLGGAAIGSPYVFPVGTSTVTATASSCGGTATRTFTVTVIDNENPTITTPVSVVVSTDAGQCAATNVALGTPTAGDNCSGVRVRNNAPASFPKGTTTVTWTATDASGNVATATQFVTVNDTEAPVVFAPAAVSASTDAGQCTATGVSLSNPVLGDNCPGTTVSNNAPAAFPKGVTTVTWTATDAAGNTATATQLVTVTDNERPTISAPAAVAVSTNAAGCTATGVALGTPTFGDNCAGTTVSNNAPATFNKGTTTVTWTATDASGNTATATQVVTVRDTEAPTITAPVAKAISTDAGSCTATNVALGTATAADNCSGVTVTNNAPAAFAKDRTTVIWTATDAAGNVATATQLVTVTDTERPTISAPAAKVVSTSTGQCSATGVSLGTATAGDNCTGVSVTNNAPATFPKGSTTVTWTATDAAGNTATATQLVTVNDTERPVLTLPASLTVAAPTGQCSAVVTFATSATDNCTGAPTVVASPASGSTFAVGTTTVTVTATDASGNVSTGSFTVTVTGSTPPAPTIAVAPAALNNGKMYLLYLGYGSQTATLTASGGTSYAWSPATGLSNANTANPVFTPTAEGTYTFTVTASGSGCSAGASTKTVTIVVEDVRCGNNNEKLQVCHNGQTICVANSALNAHLGHGDKLGNCAAPRPAAPAEVATASAAPALAVYPNPTADQATVAFHAPADGTATVVVYNELGQVVARLFDGAVTSGQDYALALNSQRLAAGLYVCRLVLNGHTELRRLTVVR
ncbi:HYR domain-containing protein, partial [Hymenobacter convexus]|uniref:HYR domain-containing protein n=1 Tax=Hymenobacter sp. CA1UV-4 TaxID=3063782 RepID=UPI0027133E5C